MDSGSGADSTTIRRPVKSKGEWTHLTAHSCWVPTRVRPTKACGAVGSPSCTVQPQEPSALTELLHHFFFFFFLSLDFNHLTFEREVILDGNDQTSLLQHVSKHHKMWYTCSDESSTLTSFPTKLLSLSLSLREILEPLCKYYQLSNCIYVCI